MKKSGRPLIVTLSALALAFTASSALASCGSGSSSSESTGVASSESSHQDSSSSSSSEPAVKCSITILACEHGKVSADKKSCQKGDFVTLTFSSDPGYELGSLLINGQEKKDDIVGGKLALVIENDVTVSATFKEIGPFNATVSIVGDYKMAGMELTLKASGQEDKKVTVGADNTFIVADAPYNITYSVSGKVAGITVDLGTFNVRSENATFNPSTVFNVGGGADFASSSFTYSYDGSLSTIEFNDAEGDIKEGDAYVATKVSISKEKMAELRTTGEATFGIGMTVGEKTCWTDIWLKGADVTSGTANVGEIVAGGWCQNAFLKEEDGVKKLNDYGNALQNGGFWLIAKYEASSGLLHNYIGTTLDDVTYFRSWGTSADNGGSYFDKNSKLNSFSVGKHSTWGNDVTLDVNFSDVRYGASLAEALGMEGKVSLSSDSSYEHGKVDVSGRPYESVTLTFTPDEGYVLSSVKVNGEEKSIEGNSLVLENYNKTSVKVEATFSEIAILKSVDVSIASNVGINGLELSLKNGSEVKTSKVANGKFTLENVTIGDTYAVSAVVNGIKTSLGSLTIKDSGNSFDPTETTGKGNGGTLDFAKGEYVYKAGSTKQGYTFTMSEDVTGDAWVATRIQVPSLDEAFTDSNEGIFGIAMTVGGQTRANHIRIFQNKSSTKSSRLVICDRAGFDISTLNDNWAAYSAALKGDGLYFVTKYESSTGYLRTYLGTSIDDVTYYGGWSGTGEKNAGFAANGKLVSFGVGYHHFWGGAPADVTFSQVKYGKTLTEALGISEAVKLSSDSTYEHGRIDVSGKPYEDVTLTFAPDEGYVLSSVKVDGEEKTVTGDSLTLEGYKRQSVKVEATFAQDAVLDSVDVTVPSGIGMDGLELTLKKGGETRTATVSGGKFNLRGVSIGDAYSVGARINGAMTSLGTLSIKESGNSFDPTSTIGTGNGGSLDLRGGSYVQKYRKAVEGYNFTLSEARSGGAYFAAKISLPESALNDMTSGKESFFGVGLNVGGTNCWTDIWLSGLEDGDRNAILANNKNEANVFAKGGALTGYGEALKSGGLWMVVQYDSDEGKIKTYLGTSAENVALLRDWTTTSGDAGWNISTGLAVTGYSIGRHKDGWGKDYSCDITYSNLGFGSTLEEALGITSTNK